MTLVLLLAGHVPHQVVDELVHLLDVHGQVGLVLETVHVVRHLHHQAARAVVVLGAVPHLHGVLKVQKYFIITDSKIFHHSCRYRRSAAFSNSSQLSTNILILSEIFVHEKKA